jgi:hypothetical protein
MNHYPQRGLYYEVVSHDKACSLGVFRKNANANESHWFIIGDDGHDVIVLDKPFCDKEEAERFASYAWNQKYAKYGFVISVKTYTEVKRLGLVE